MRWRMVPGLDLPVIRTTKCLLLGAGTLGCNVARTLLGWGVETITFVDHGNLSYSNPVRQSLYSFEDVRTRDEGTKANTAAASLKRVYPHVQTEGISLSIPMPGHLIQDQAQARKDIQHLRQLIQGHDVVFLLTDSRESRWLPTLLCIAHQKVTKTSRSGWMGG